jgi:hypothetical protein
MAFIDEHRERYAVKPICRLLKGAVSDQRRGPPRAESSRNSAKPHVAHRSPTYVDSGLDIRGNAMHFRAACLLAVLCSSAATASDRPPPPAAGCVDARDVVEARHLASDQLLVRTSTQRFRIDLVPGCSPSSSSDHALLAPHGWVCGGRPERELLRVDTERCSVAEVTPLSAKQFAASIRADDATNAALTRLATVEVHAKAPDRSRFLRSTDYCFDPRWVRGWSEHAKGIVVTTTARRSGGHTYYRIELGQSCPELSVAQLVSFSSRIGGAICGNPGDVALPSRGTPAGGFAAGGIGGESFSSRGCPITAVYPVTSPSDT